MRMSVQRLDWFFILPIFASIIMIAEIDPPRDPAIQWGEWVQGGVLVAATVVVSVLIAIGAAIDRRCSEEYTFQILANASLVAVASMALINLFWLIGVKAFDLPDMSSENMVGVTMLAMVLSYYWFRLKGIAQ